MELSPGITNSSDGPANTCKEQPKTMQHSAVGGALSRIEVNGFRIPSSSLLLPPHAITITTIAVATAFQIRLHAKGACCSSKITSNNRNPTATLASNFTKTTPDISGTSPCHVSECSCSHQRGLRPVKRSETKPGFVSSVCEQFSRGVRLSVRLGGLPHGKNERRAVQRKIFRSVLKASALSCPWREKATQLGSKI